MTREKKEPAAAGLAALRKEFNEYAYRVSHDLSGPVRAMVEFSKLLAQEYGHCLDEDGKLYLSMVVENGQKMQEMMAGLLQYSRLNTIPSTYSKIDVARLVQMVQVELGTLMNTTGAELLVGELPFIDADIAQLKLVWMALIENAMKFQPSHQRPRIVIGAQKKEDYWLFSVADNGIGIKPEFQQKIFQLFARLHPDNEYGGVGVGLALAQKIVHQHHGDIWVESNIGQGSTFYFTVPIEPK